ncbi:MAG: hypothetical protein ACR2PT_07720 [Endozoicomonas sp.]
MKRLSKSLLLIPLLGLTTSMAFATSKPLAIPVGSQSEELRRTLLLPERGQSMESVRNRLGDPQAADTIGQPAITTWKYQDMTVYFEGTTVLRAVVHHRPQTTQPTTLADGG